jgi:hypothetical protein
MENKAAFGGLAVISLQNLDSIDLEVTIRIRHADTGRRESRLMSPGDLTEIELAGQPHTLYLDQIRGNMAFFIMDGLPLEKPSE